MNKTIKITTIALAFLGLAACGGNKQDDKKSATTTKKEAEKVQVLTLQSERIAKTLELSTTLEGYETMNISPSITGHIEHIYVQVGSRVQKGSMLVRMDQTQLNTTRINLASTKTELDRVTALKASGSVSEQVYDQTKAAYDQLVESERFQNENTFVKAQCAGVISAKNFESSVAVPVKSADAPPAEVVNCVFVFLALRMLILSLASKLTFLVLPFSVARVCAPSLYPAVKVICLGAFCVSSIFEQALSASIPATAIKIYFFIVIFIIRVNNLHRRLPSEDSVLIVIKCRAFVV